jgi:murein DD-endopeptidase MepM/ murein hydrolase activator NlpD
MLPVIFITGFEMELLSTQLFLRKLESNGINYDAFRELKLAEDTLQQAQKRIEELQEEHPRLDQGDGIDDNAYLTFSMLAASFDLYDNKLVNEELFLKGMKRIGATQGYRRLYRYYNAILGDIEYFPIPRIEGDTEDVSYIDTWSNLRSYGGSRRHEGCDIMAKNNIRGYYPVISITEGVIEKMGWLEQGGYRIGIRSPSGGYFYYAHLNSYSAELQIGDTVIAGQLLGFMGDSGYGSEGTVGQFDVHLHLGIYIETSAGELSVNPYYVLKILEKNRPTYQSLP